MDDKEKNSEVQNTERIEQSLGDGRLRLKGKLKSYLRWPLGLLMFLTMVAVGVFFIDVRAGVVVLAGDLVYGIIMIILYSKYQAGRTQRACEFCTGLRTGAKYFAA